MAYLLKFSDGTVQPLAGRIALTKQDNDITKPLMPTRTLHKASDITQAARRCAELQAENPKWPKARVRNRVAREMGLSTVQLRYLLGRG